MLLTRARAGQTTLPSSRARRSTAPGSSRQIYDHILRASVSVAGDRRSGFWKIDPSVSATVGRNASGETSCGISQLEYLYRGESFDTSAYTSNRRWTVTGMPARALLRLAISAVSGTRQLGFGTRSCKASESLELSGTCTRNLNILELEYQRHAPMSANRMPSFSSSCSRHLPLRREMLSATPSAPLGAVQELTSGHIRSSVPMPCTRRPRLPGPASTCPQRSGCRLLVRAGPGPSAEVP